MQDFLPANENNSASLLARLETACEGLIYISETDAPILPFLRSKADRPQAPNAEAAAEIPFNDFFAKLTEERDWYGDAEKKTAKRFLELQKLLEGSLRDLRVLRTGRVQIDIYVIGTDADGNTLGFQTKAVET